MTSNAIVEVAARTLCEMQGHATTVLASGAGRGRSLSACRRASSPARPVAFDADDGGDVGGSDGGEEESGASQQQQQPTVMMLDWGESDGQAEAPGLPEGWTVTWHESGLPLYVHRASAVCTLARPYVVCQQAWQCHSVPINAVPCLHYREAKCGRAAPPPTQPVAVAAACPAAGPGSHARRCSGGSGMSPLERAVEHSEHHYSKGAGAFSVKEDVDSPAPSEASLKPICAADSTLQSGGGSFADSRFLDIDDILRILAETPALARVPALPSPRGRAAAASSCCWYVVANEKNNERRARGRKSQFYDGRLWRSRGASTNKTYFLLDECGKTRCTLTLHDGQYCVAKHSASRAQRQPLDRQPAPDELLVVYRYYARDKDDATLQRRVTWVSDCPPTLDRCILNKALYEYKRT